MLSNYYRPPKKLWEGNVLTGVCLSLCSGEGGPHAIITHDALDRTVQGPLVLPPLDMGHGYTLTPTKRHGHLFKLVRWTSVYSPTPPTVLTSGGHGSMYG